jgi:hypothetical protein
MAVHSQVGNGTGVVTLSNDVCYRVFIYIDHSVHCLACLKLKLYLGILVS